MTHQQLVEVLANMAAHHGIPCDRVPGRGVIVHIPCPVEPELWPRYFTLRAVSSTKQMLEIIHHDH